MKITKRIAGEVIFETVIFFSAITAISLFYMNNLLLTVIILALGGIVIKLRHGKDDICLFVAGAILGAGGETICIHFGAWRYANPTFLGIPVWLPLAWGLSVLVIKRIAETFVEMEKK